MSQPIISVRNLGKEYHLGATTAHNTLRDHITHGLKAIVSSFYRPTNKKPETEEDNFWALRDVSFDIQPGEVVGIIGRNGAGKSTLLKILSQITEPTEGEVRMRGRVASLLEVGTGFHPELSGRENIFLNGAILGMPQLEIKRKFDEIVAFAEVEKFLDTPVKHYSSGMYVRLAFAVAAHLEPEILIVDEVLAVGDSSFQRKCLGKMQDVSRREGRTVLFVSHNMAAIQKLCSRCILLKSGKLASSGKVDEVIQEYSRENTGGGGSPFSPETQSARIGNGLLRFTNVRIQSGQEFDVSIVHSGQDVVIKINYESKITLCQNVVIYLGIYDTYDTLLLGFSNEITCGPFNELPQNGAINCRIPKLPLMPGTYKFVLNCQINNETADIVYNAATLNVHAGDYYGSGRLFPNPKLRVLAPHSWEVLGATNIPPKAAVNERS